MQSSLCLLPIDICKCKYRGENEICLNNDNKCGFKEPTKKSTEQDIYIRPKKWYEELRQNNKKK